MLSSANNDPKLFGSLENPFTFIGESHVSQRLSFGAVQAFFHHVPVGQSIAATAEEEVARSTAISVVGDTRGDQERHVSLRNADNGEVDNSTTGLDAKGFIRVCLQLLRENFLAKVRASQ